TARGLVGER
ncbi:putative lipoprotein, partial [Vibrio parahaemolyticus VP-48]